MKKKKPRILRLLDITTVVKLKKKKKNFFIPSFLISTLSLPESCEIPTAIRINFPINSKCLKGISNSNPTKINLTGSSYVRNNLYNYGYNIL